MDRIKHLANAQCPKSALMYFFDSLLAGYDIHKYSIIETDGCIRINLGKASKEEVDHIRSLFGTEVNLGGSLYRYDGKDIAPNNEIIINLIKIE